MKLEEMLSHCNIHEPHGLKKVQDHVCYVPKTGTVLMLIGYMSQWARDFYYPYTNSRPTPSVIESITVYPGTDVLEGATHVVVMVPHLDSMHHVVADLDEWQMQVDVYTMSKRDMYDAAKSFWEDEPQDEDDVQQAAEAVWDQDLTVEQEYEVQRISRYEDDI